MSGFEHLYQALEKNRELIAADIASKRAQIAEIKERMKANTMDGCMGAFSLRNMSAGPSTSITSNVGDSRAQSEPSQAQAQAKISHEELTLLEQLNKRGLFASRQSTTPAPSAARENGSASLSSSHPSTGAPKQQSSDDEISKLREQLALVTAERDFLKKEAQGTEKLEHLLTNLASEKARLVDGNAALRRQYERRVNLSLAANIKLEDELAESKAILGIANSELERICNQNDERVENLKYEIQQLKNVNETLEAMLARREKERDRLADAADQAEAIIEDQRRELRVLESKNERLIAANENRYNENKELIDAKHDLFDRNMRLERRVYVLKSKTRYLKSVRKELSTQKASLQHHIHELQQRLAREKDLSRCLDGALDESTRETITARDERDGLNRILLLTERDYARQIEENDRLRQEHRPYLYDRFNRQLQENDELRDELQDTDEHLDWLYGRSDRINGRLGDEAETIENGHSENAHDASSEVVESVENDQERAEPQDYSADQGPVEYFPTSPEYSPAPASPPRGATPDSWDNSVYSPTSPPPHFQASPPRGATPDSCDDSVYSPTSPPPHSPASPQRIVTPYSWDDSVPGGYSPTSPPPHSPTEAPVDYFLTSLGYSPAPASPPRSATPDSWENSVPGGYSPTSPPPYVPEELASPRDFTPDSPYPLDWSTIYQPKISDPGFEQHLTAERSYSELSADPREPEPTPSPSTLRSDNPEHIYNADLGPTSDSELEEGEVRDSSPSDSGSMPDLYNSTPPPRPTPSSSFRSALDMEPIGSWEYAAEDSEQLRREARGRERREAEVNARKRAYEKFEDWEDADDEETGEEDVVEISPAKRVRYRY